VRCGCPDDAEPCKQIAAVLYVFAQQLDGDPWLLLAWHGRDRQTLLQALQQGPQGAAASGAKAGGRQVRLPPWWPAGLRSRPDPRLQPPDHLPPDPPERALQRLGSLELPGRPPDWQELLAEMYQKLVAEE
jgi:uncharacterized Zn finger protein